MPTRDFEQYGTKYIKIPKDVNNPHCVALFKILDQIDKLMFSKEVKERLFTKKQAIDAFYTPLVHTVKRDYSDYSDDSDDSDDSDYDNYKKKKRPNNPQYIKVRFNEHYQSKKINLKIYNSNSTDKNCNVDKFEDLFEYFKFESEFIPTIKLKRIWCNRNISKTILFDGSRVDKINYGITLIMTKVIFKNSSNFDDCDIKSIKVKNDESESKTKFETKSETKSKTKSETKKNKTARIIDSDDSDNSNDSDA
jgi:hypothetical protein